MDKNNNDVLNLDEMLGEKKLKVLYQGGEYPLRTVKSLSPQEFGRVMAYGAKFSTLTQDQFEKDSGLAVFKGIDDLLEIIGPELPRYKLTLKERLSRGYKRKFALSIQEAAKIMEFWNRENRSKNVLGAGMPRPKTKRR